MDIPDTFNSIVYATRNPSTLQDLYKNYEVIHGQEDIHPILDSALTRAILNMQPIPNSDIVFTDDRAPIEWMTNSMVLNYVLFGGIEELQQ